MITPSILGVGSPNQKETTNVTQIDVG